MAARALAGVTLGQAALLAIAGIASYYGTTYVLDQIASGVTDPKFIGAMAFRKAHVALADKLGRQPNRAELRELMNQVVNTMGKRLAVRAALPFGLGELISAVTGGRV